MANPHKGEVSFKAGEKEYVLSFSANALVEIEVIMDIDLDQLIEKFIGKKVKLAEMRTMFWQGLCDHHAELSLDDTKKILKHLTPAEMGDLLGRAFALAMPKRSGEDAPPPEPGGPEVGTGPASSTPGTISEDPKPNSGG